MRSKTDELIAAGWEISEPPQQGRLYSVEFRHELTVPQFISWHAPPTAADIVAAVEQTPEFDKVSHAPALRPHASLISDIRGMAAIHDWTAAIVRDLARTLYRAGAISHAEAEWLAAAGASWGPEPYDPPPHVTP